MAKMLPRNFLLLKAIRTREITANIGATIMHAIDGSNIKKYSNLNEIAAKMAANRPITSDIVAEKQISAGCAC